MLNFLLAFATTITMRFTQAEIDLMARVVMSESSVEPYEVKVGVAQTMINRLLSDEFPDSIYEVVDGQYSTTNNGDPNEDCYDAVYAVINNPYIYPSDMFWFRSKHYHKFANPYMHIPGTNTYFSTKTDYNKLLFEDL